MNLYRVLPYQDSAARDQPGHPLYVPPSRGVARIDNPEIYDALYLGDTPAGAVAEAFGWMPQWDVGMLRGSRILPGSVRALATYRLAEYATLCDLDDAQRLIELGLRPSQVVTRDREVTQKWALQLFEARAHVGVRWWSYYDPRWGSVGLWDLRALTVVDVRVLALYDEEIVDAARTLVRVVTA